MSGQKNLKQLSDLFWNSWAEWSFFSNLELMRGLKGDSKMLSDFFNNFSLEIDNHCQLIFKMCPSERVFTLIFFLHPVLSSRKHTDGLIMMNDNDVKKHSQILIFNKKSRATNKADN